ncbi:glycoside hydrolase family 25 protein [Flavobacterium restrictum]|uniref:Lysozyme n=1 Tax=Flavobacterium restrictum TaxID=2594428 RepID=A0A553E2M9_9FLAO|nr:glycoside hydrolase family 25 protein [Flavobacterium restrictum]TRX39235.1 hypothetical protein FNW21_09880 [Flavobacterium restrictum]
MKNNILTALLLFVIPFYAQNNNFNTRPWDNKDFPIIIDPYHGNKIVFEKLITDKRVMGIIHKASEGLVADSKYVSRCKITKTNHLLFASYHLGNLVDPIKQADFYLNIIKNNLNQPMAIDIEDYELDVKNPKKPYMPLANAEKFINRIYEKTKKYPIVYVNNKVFKEINLEYNQNSVFAKCPLWYARFVITLPNLNNKVWRKVSLWQFSSEINCTKTGNCWYNIPGTDFDIDINVFNGTYQELNQFWKR